MDEQRLPFPIHGTRLSGDGDPQRGVGEAARLLYFANLIAQTTGVPVYRLSRQTPYGQVTASVHGLLAFKTVHSVAEPEEPAPEEEAETEEEVTGITRLVWLPEGFVITPRTAEAPEGYGMPPTGNGRGTPDGPLHEVIINRFRDNQYPDAVYRIASKGKGARVFAANLFFMDWEMEKGEFGIGVMDGTTFLPQFKKRFVPQYRESDAGRWHCHRPQAGPNEDVLAALVRAESNLLRGEVGQPPLGPPLRGQEGELSQNIAYQMRWSGVFGHDRVEYREGHRMFDERAQARAAVNPDGGENLYGDGGHVADAAGAYAAVDGWRRSPGHYANMVRDWGADKSRYGALDSAITEAGEVPAGGMLGAQIFTAADRWVTAGPGVRGERAPVTCAGEQRMFTHIYQGRRHEVFGEVAVQYRGRSIYLTAEPTVTGNIMEPLSGTTVVDGGAETHLRVAVLHLPDDYPGKAYFVLYEGAIHNFAATRREVVRYELPQGSSHQISTPVWSVSGKKVALCYTTITPVPPGRILGSVFDPAPTTFVGQQLHFIEVDGDSLHTHGTDSLQIDPTDFGANHRGSSCQGSARLLPTYDGETLRYVSIEVDSRVYHSSDRFEKRVYGALVFPDGTKIAYADQSVSRVDGGENKPIKGFVRHILPFDVSDPASVAYIQYDHPEQASEPGISARLIIRGKEVKHSPLAYTGEFPGPVYYHPTYFGNIWHTLDSFRGNPHADPYWGSGFSFIMPVIDKHPPGVVFDGVLVGESHTYPPSRLSVGPWDAYRGPVSTSPSYTSYVLLGPVLLRDGVPAVADIYDSAPGDEVFDRVERFQYARYGEEWLYAGRIENTLGGMGEFLSFRPPLGSPPVRVVRSAWLGDDQYYYHSSLDLKAITGLPDIKDNILPIGVL